MFASSHQIQAVASEEQDRIILRNNRATGPGRDSEGTPCPMADHIVIEHDRYTDVAHIDLCLPQEGERVDVLNVGARLGFPGQIVARVNIEQHKVYGITVQNFSGFKWRLFWMYKMASIRRALELMLNVLRTALWIDHNNRPARLHV